MSNKVALYNLLERILFEHCHCVAIVSLSICGDIIEHHERDLRRLIALHPNGVHPIKHIGYLAFWVRKLKPISSAFPLKKWFDKNSTIDSSEEICLINEMASLYVAEHLLFTYTKDQRIFKFTDSVDVDKVIYEMENVLSKITRGTVDIEEKDINLFQSIIYDMRYRTFGPHHVVHFLSHVLHSFMVKWETQEGRKLELVYAG